MILVLVGMSTTHPFDRLIMEMDRLAGEGVLGEEVVIQTGCSRVEVRNAKSVKFLDGKELEKAIYQSSAIVSHAGMGAVLDAKRIGRPIVVLARRKELGEARDNHQLDTLENLTTEPGVYVARSEKEILGLLTKARSEEYRRIQPSEKNQLIDFLRGLVSEAENTEFAKESNRRRYGDYIYTDDIPEQFWTGDTKFLSQEPSLSLQIPTLNSMRTIKRCLESFAAQEYDRKEIIVVDGGSTDGTVDVAKEFGAKLIHCSGKLGEARQAAVENTHAEILAIFDSDIIFPDDPTWLHRNIRKFAVAQNIGTVCPAQVPPKDGSLLCRLYVNLWHEIRKNRIRTQRGLLGGTNSFFLREAIEKVQGFDKGIHWGEDFDISRKLKDAGYAVLMTEDSIVHDTFRSYHEFVRKQRLVAESFSKRGIRSARTSMIESLLEHILVGFGGMAKGIVFGRDPSWLLLPLLILERISIFGPVLLRRN